MASLASVIVALTARRARLLAPSVLAVAVGALAGLPAASPMSGCRIPSFIATLAIGGVLAGTRSGHLATSASITLEEPSATISPGSPATSLGLPNEVLSSALDRARRRPRRAGHTRFGRYSAADRRRRAGGLRLRRQGRPAEDHRLLAVRRPSRPSPASSWPAGSASGSPTLANELLLPSIAAVIVGGTAITGGVGSVWRTLVGALIISVVRIGMTFVGVNIFAQQIVFGAVLIAAVAITIDRSKIPIVK